MDGAHVADSLDALGVGEAQRVQEVDAGVLEVQQVVSVVDHPHHVRLAVPYLDGGVHMHLFARFRRLARVPSIIIVKAARQDVILCKMAWFS